MYNILIKQQGDGMKKVIEAEAFVKSIGEANIFLPVLKETFEKGFDGLEVSWLAS